MRSPPDITRERRWAPSWSAETLSMVRKPLSEPISSPPLPSASSSVCRMSPASRRGSGQRSDVLVVAGPPGGLEASHVSARQSAQAASESHCAGHWPSEGRRPKRGGCWLCVWDLALLRWQFSSSGSLFLRSLARVASLLAYKFSLAFTSLGRARERKKVIIGAVCESELLLIS